PDPASPNFAFSVAGVAFFVIGFHPFAADPARTFSRPALVFNAHSQFTKLRDRGVMQAAKQKIRSKDAGLHADGMPNPLMADHGTAPEIAQYSGLRDLDVITPFYPAVSDDPTNHPE